MPIEPFNIQVSRAIEHRRSELAEMVVRQQYELQPELLERYGARGRDRCLEDTGHHLSSILAAIALASPDTFIDYVTWVKRLLAAHKVPAEDLARNLICIRDVLNEALPEKMRVLATEYVEAGLSRLLDG